MQEPHHRVILVDEGVIPLLYDMLTSSYQQCLKPANAGPLLFHTCYYYIMLYVI